MPIKDKIRIRREMRRQRRMLTNGEQEIAADALAEKLLRLPGIVGSRRIAAYFANDGEIDPLPAMIEWMGRGKQCFLPVLFQGQRPRIRFALFTDKTSWILNQFGILEPNVGPRFCLDPVAFDWILLPLVAFDTFGNRLGMGGGYYDASLEVLRHRQNWRRPRLVGLAHEFQKIDALNVDGWDVPLHGVLTDHRFYPAHNLTGPGI